MKQIFKIAFLFIFFILFENAYSQSPQGISYQAVARDSTGKLQSNQPIKIKFTIRDSIASGNIVFQEYHFDTTDAMGLFDLVIGQGIALNGNFEQIDWGKNNKFLQVDIDANIGTYINMGVQKMMSVPYALYAGKTMQTSGCIQCPSMVSSIATNSNSLYLFTASAYCISLTENGYSDWRLPSSDEMEYLRDVIQISLLQSNDYWVKSDITSHANNLYCFTARGNFAYANTNGGGLNIKTICIR